MRTSKEKMDSDVAEREQRKCNIIVRDVPESSHRHPQDRQAEDWRFARKLLHIVKDEELVKVVRAGPPIGSRPDDTRVNRPMIITVSNPELASYLHNYGCGWKRTSSTGQVFWVNPDLIKADRVANYRARQLAKHRRSGRRPPHVVLDELNDSPNASRPAGRVSPGSHAASSPHGGSRHSTRASTTPRSHHRDASVSSINSTESEPPIRVHSQENLHHRDADRSRSQRRHNESVRSRDRSLPDFV